MIIVILVLLSVESFLELDSSTNTLAVLISTIALLLSFFGFLFKWISTPFSDSESYIEDICEMNSERIARIHRIPDDLLLFALLKMKSHRPGVLLTEFYALSPELFTKKYLLNRLYE